VNLVMKARVCGLKKRNEEKPWFSLKRVLVNCNENCSTCPVYFRLSMVPPSFFNLKLLDWVQNFTAEFLSLVADLFILIWVVTDQTLNPVRWSSKVKRVIHRN
jgi:hypothetical protein